MFKSIPPGSVFFFLVSLIEIWIQNDLIFIVYSFQLFLNNILEISKKNIKM